MQARIWALLPAAGIGRRMSSNIPKQYLRIGGRTVIEHTVARLRSHSRVHAVVVAVAAHDPRWPRLGLAGDEGIHVAPGGAERSDSVLNALDVVAGLAGDDDWALVHDAVRPCLGAEDLDRLIAAALASEDGALLAVPARDTIKRVEGDRVRETVARDALWQALTPQMFRIRELRPALARARAAGTPVTDECQAMELAGRAPTVVQGRADNIKITRAEDLALASLLLERGEDRP